MKISTLALEALSFLERILKKGVTLARMMTRRPNPSTRTFPIFSLRSPPLSLVCRQKKWSVKKWKTSESMEGMGRPMMPSRMLQRLMWTKVLQTHLRKPMIVAPRKTAKATRVAMTRRIRIRRTTSYKCCWKMNFPSVTIVPRSMQSQKSSVAIMQRARRPGNVYLAPFSSSLGFVSTCCRITPVLLP